MKQKSMLIDEVIDQATEIIRDKILRKQEKEMKYLKRVASKDTTFEVKNDMLMKYVKEDYIYFGTEMQKLF